jgi:hypothetical protein
MKKAVEEHRRCLNGVYTPTITGGVPTEIRTGHLPNTSLRALIIATSCWANRRQGTVERTDMVNN